MKNTRVGLWVMAAVAASFLAFKTSDSGSIKGTVSPPDAASMVWAISSTDTLKASVNQGAFIITGVKTGTYKVIVDGNDPYKDGVRDNVVVASGAATDVGEIKLVK